MGHRVQEALRKEGVFTLFLLGSILAGAFLFLFPQDRFEKTREFFTQETVPESELVGVQSPDGSGESSSPETVVQPGDIQPAPASAPPVQDTPVVVKTLMEQFAEILGIEFSFVPVPMSEIVIFETLTPYGTLVSVEKTSVLHNGALVGTLYRIQRKDPAIGNTLDFLKRLATSIRPDPQVSIEDTIAYGKGGFLYIHLAQKEKFRIVVESKDATVYAWDIAPGYRDRFEPLLKLL